MDSKKILVICGPTSSGKTTLALKIAATLGKANILSADSRQIYKDLSILTGKDIPENLPEGIEFFGIDLVGAETSFSVSDFINYATLVINESVQNQTPLIIVGGTGLYIKSITENYLNIRVPPNQTLRSRLEKKDIKSLQDILRKSNAEKFSSMNNSDINNPRRLIRAIEIAKSSVQNINDLSGNSKVEFIKVGIKVEKNILKDQIRKRVIDRISSGVIQEVQNLQRTGVDGHNPLLSSLGLKEIAAYINGQMTKDDLVNKWTNSELDYARRQMVWFKKQSGIIWYDKDMINEGVVNALAQKLK